MLIRPELQALRVDDGPQRQAQSLLAEATERWSKTSGLAAAEAELQAYAGGAKLEDLPVLSGLFPLDYSSADELVHGFVSNQIAQLQADPLGQVILRHHVDPITSALSLARSGTATLTLQAVDGPALARSGLPSSITFSPSESYSRVLAGTGEIEIVRLQAERPGGAELARERSTLAPGNVSHRLGHGEAIVLREVPTSLVMLTLQRRMGEGGVTREYLLSDGSLVHQAAGSPRDSRLELSAAVLGRMGRSDAAPMLAAMAEEEAALSLRWQALRECIGLDCATGFAVLGRIARRGSDPLAPHAGALRAQLLDRYPQLACIAREEPQCLV